jgi:hypothetical protein
MNKVQQVKWNKKHLNFLGPVYMEASYSARRVTRPGGTNKRSVYMEPSYSAFAAWLPHDAQMAPKHKKDFSRLKR